MRRQRGAFAVFVALALTVTLGMVGMAADGGRLLSNKSELQAAADACALASVAELVCTSATDLSCVNRAIKKGVAVGGLNKRDLQGQSITVAEADVNFAVNVTDSPYAKTAGNARYARCDVYSKGLVPSMLRVVGVSTMDAAATATATLGQGQKFCTNMPITVCPGALTKGQWLTASYVAKDGTLTGTFQWALFSGKGASSIAEGLKAKNGTCVSKGDLMTFPGVASGLSDEYNSHFGLYKDKNPDFSTVPTPDKTGYTYPDATHPVAQSGTQVSAYSDYLGKRAANTPYDPSNKDNNITGNAYTAATQAQLAQYGASRRLLALPVASTCDSTKNPSVQGTACMLMLNTMPTGNGASKTPIYMEYLGTASEPGSPCQISGLPGGAAGSLGNTVPALVR